MFRYEKLLQGLLIANRNEHFQKSNYAVYTLEQLPQIVKECRLRGEFLIDMFYF